MAITNAIMQMRRGLEADFDPDKMRPGEWAVSTDKKYVRICFSAGVCVRMATYDAFEKDMEDIQAILKECQTIEEAVKTINTQVSSNAQAVVENTSKAKSYMETASSKANEASGYAKTASDKASEALQSAKSASASMETATQKANLASEKANVATEKANEAISASNSATKSAENADLSETNAKKSEDNAYDYSNISKSYAVGETGERLGEETDNSKYYSEVAKTESDKATTEADRAKAEADRAQGLVGGDFVTNSQIKEYSLIKDTGYELGLSIDNTNYVMTVQLKNANGSVLSEKSIDFPIESMVINATYSNGVITLTLQNGTTLPVDVSALVSGLVKNTFTIAGIDMKDNITATELKTALGLNNVANVTVNNQAPTFTQATTRANIASGEKLSVLFGKIMKWFADLKAIAFSGSYNDLSNRPSPLDTYEEITANTKSGKFAGALGVQEVFEQLTNSLNTKLGSSKVIFSGSAKALNTSVNFDANNQTAFLIHVGGTSYFILEFSSNGISYKFSNDNGASWATIFTK